MNYVDPALLLQYLFARVKQDRKTQKLPLTRAIMGALSHMAKDNPNFNSNDDQHLQRLVCCVAQFSQKQRIPVKNILYQDRIGFSGLGYGGQVSDTEVSKCLNALDAAAYLGQMLHIRPLWLQLVQLAARALFVGRSALHCAFAAGHYDIAEVLTGFGLEYRTIYLPSFWLKGCDSLLSSQNVDIETTQVSCAIWKASATGNLLALETIMNRVKYKGALLSTKKLNIQGVLAFRDYLQRIIVFASAFYGHECIMKFAMQQKEDLRCDDTRTRLQYEIYGRLSPLEVAARRGHLHVVRLLLTLEPKYTHGALRQSSRAGFREVSAVLIDSVPAIPHKYGDGGRRFAEVFIDITRRGYVEIMKLFLEKGCHDLAYPFSKIVTKAWKIAEAKGSVEIMALMKQHLPHMNLGQPTDSSHI